MSKPLLRARLLAARRDTGPDPAGDARLQAVVRGLALRLAGRTVAGYAPMRTEPGGPDLPSVLAAAVGPAGRVLLPVVRADLDLDWAVYAGEFGPPDPDALGRGPREPAGPRLGPTAVADAELVVVPALAVDRHGVRLGRGGGSYDRALSRVSPGIPVVALLRDDELVTDDLPAEPHDRPVTAVVTPVAGLVQLPPPLDSWPPDGA